VETNIKSGSITLGSGGSEVVPMAKVVGINNERAKPKGDVDLFSESLEKVRGLSPDYTGSKRIEGDASAYNYLELVEPPYNLEYLAELMDMSPAHAAAVHIKASNAVGLGVNLVDSPSTKRKLDSKSTDADRDKLREKITRLRERVAEEVDLMNEDESLDEILYKVVVDLESLGNGYLEIGRVAVPDENGYRRINYLGHIPAKTIRIRARRDGFVQLANNREVVFFNNFGDRGNPGVTDDPLPNEIIHWSYYSPTSEYYGIPSIVAAKNAVAGSEFASQYNLEYFENKAVPRHIIILKGAELKSDAQQRLLNFFETGFKGSGSAHRSLFVPLPADTDRRKVSLEIKPIEAGEVDLSFDKYDKVNEAKIFMVHRVPKSKATNDSNSQAVVADAAKTFKAEVIKPLQKKLQKKLNGVLREITDAFLWEFVEQSLIDENIQSAIDDREIKVGLVTVNEIRARRGLPGLPWGDKKYEQTPKQNADAKANGSKNRQRDTERQAGQAVGAAEGKNPQGDGRRYE